MDLLSVLKDVTGSGDLQKLGQQFGLDQSAVEQIMGQVMPALSRGIQNGAKSSNGLDSLIGALQNGNHQKYVDNIDTAISSTGVQEGNNILGHILGSKDVSRNVAAQAASSSGFSQDVIKQMLPMLATLAMGALSKQTGGGSQLQSKASSRGGLQDMIGSLLDSNKDGSAMDDVLNMAKKIF